MRLSRQFKASLFFLKKDFERTKTQISQNQPTKAKISEQKSMKATVFLCAQKLLRGGWALVLFVRSKSFRKKK